MKFERLFTGFITLAVVTLVAISLGITPFRLGTYSQGYRDGKVYKLSTKGIVIKTTEGELDTGGFKGNKDKGTMGTVWEFSVIDPKVVKDLEKVDNNTVRLHYTEYLINGWCHTKYIVTKVEDIHASPSNNQ